MVSGGYAPGTTFASGPSLSRARHDVLMRLTHAASPRTIADLEQSTGRHANTVREHVDALVRLGLARRLREAPLGPGRPALRYAALHVDEIRTDYAALVTDLVALVERQAHRPGGEAEATGLRWGTHLAEETSPQGPGETIRSLVRLLVGLGFQPPPSTAPPVLVARPGCDDALAWRVHLGVARGAWAQWAVRGPGPQLCAPEGAPGQRLTVG